MKFKNKIFFIISFLLIFILFTTNVFASSSYVSDTEGGKVTFTLDNNVWSVQGTFTGKNINYTYPVSNDSDYNIIPFLREGNGTIYYCYFKVPVNSTYYATRYKTTGYLYFDFICNENYFYCDNNNGGNILVNIVANTSKRIDNRSTYCMCTFYSTDGETVLFQLPVTEIPGVQIPALETVEQIPEAMAKTLKIVIPVGLIVLSIGLVIYLIKRVKYFHL